MPDNLHPFAHESEPLLSRDEPVRVRGGARALHPRAPPRGTGTAVVVAVSAAAPGALRRGPMSRAPEVLAPAGDADALQAAVRAGADAVYFGMRGFNARAR